MTYSSKGSLDVGCELFGGERSRGRLARLLPLRWAPAALGLCSLAGLGLQVFETQPSPGLYVKWGRACAVLS